MREIPLLALLGLSGAIGALARHAISSWANPLTTSVPCGTLLVNVLGCFLLGALACAAGLDQANVSPQFKLAIGTGFLGSFTTFSTFGVETFERLNRGAVGFAIANVALNVVVGLVAVWLGYTIAVWWYGAPAT